MTSSISAYTRFWLLGIVFFIVLFLVVIVPITLYVSDRIVTPVTKLTSMCRAIINDGEHASIVITPEAVSSTATCYELARVTSLFKTLVIVLRFTDPRYFERVSTEASSPQPQPHSRMHAYMHAFTYAFIYTHTCATKHRCLTV